MAKKRFSLQKVKVEVLALLKKPACPLDPLAQPLP
ncbi:hypothetical protein PENARI_c003G03185 [Penicillium arizonense]|uniref:Uncharacterized protein n=1 Tax=Penicillium arizonense TaxID=1835702 RepID=A0A1F5LUC5_PENAI|nr:hypothetical protein PENARI_c003G03185 [Penicillium arizonense]OGE56529.1 hypothetical protein PENARI_c003G03185 [Penicillium arizonense]